MAFLYPKIKKEIKHMMKENMPQTIEKCNVEM